jgi:hypothetical protein
MQCDYHSRLNSQHNWEDQLMSTQKIRCYHEQDIHLSSKIMRKATTTSTWLCWPPRTNHTSQVLHIIGEVRYVEDVTS